MKLALINLWKEGGLPPLGIAYIASYLRKYSDIDNIIIVDKENSLRRIRKEKPDIVGITSTTMEYPEAGKFAISVKQEFDLPIIIGGMHISALPRALPECFDIGVVGEGEQTMLKLMQVYQKYGEFPENKLKNTDGIVFRKNSKILVTKRMRFIEPLDIIPYPARDLLKMKEHYLKPRKGIIEGDLTRGTSMITSRGCPYHCIFCTSPRFWEMIRFHSAEYVVGEIRELIEKYKVKSIVLVDDLFTADKKRLAKVVELIKEEKINERVQFACNCRADLIDEHTCKLLKKMNMVFTSFGFESGSERILNFLKKCTVTIKDNETAVKLCKKFGLRVGGYIMIGNPCETKEDLELTLNFIKSQLDHVGIFITTPYPGTELLEIAKKYGFISGSTNWENFNNHPTHALKNNLYINKEMERKEFLKIFSMIEKEAEKKNYAHIRFEVKDLFSLDLMKRAVMKPNEVLKHLKSFLRLS